MKCFCTFFLCVLWINNFCSFSNNFFNDHSNNFVWSFEYFFEILKFFIIVWTFFIAFIKQFWFDFKYLFFKTSNEILNHSAIKGQKKLLVPRSEKCSKYAPKPCITLLQHLTYYFFLVHHHRKKLIAFCFSSTRKEKKQLKNNSSDYTATCVNKCWLWIFIERGKISVRKNVQCL